MATAICLVAGIELVDYVADGLGVVSGIADTKLIPKLAQHFVDKEIAHGLMSHIHLIKSALDNLKSKDQKVARDMFDDGLDCMKTKFHGFSSCPAESIKNLSDRIEKDLARAQDKALEANHSGLSTEEQLDSFKWIIVSEMLRVLNDATSKKDICQDDVKRIENIMIVAQRKCYKYLKRANELEGIKEFVLSKISVEGYERNWKLQLNDRTAQVRELLLLNILSREFFRCMQVKCLRNLIYAKQSKCPVGGPNQRIETLRKRWTWGGEALSGVSGALIPFERNPLQQQFADLSTNVDVPLPFGQEPLHLVNKLLEVDGVNKGIIYPDMSDPSAAFHYAQLVIHSLGSVSLSDPDSCLKAGLQEAIDMKHGGTVSASSYQAGYPPEEALEGGIVDVEWKSKVPSQSNFIEHLQRDLPTSVSPRILAIKSWHGDNKHCGPLKFKFLARQKDSQEWETLVEVEGLQWNYYNHWKFWSVPTVKTFQTFRLEVNNNGKGVLIAYMQLFCAA